MFVINIPYAVFQDDGIAIAKLVVLVYQILLVFCPTFGRKLLRLQERRELARLVQLSKSTFLEQTAFQFTVGELLITFNNDVAHLHLFLLVYINIKDDLIFVGNIFTLMNSDFGILEAFVFKIFLS